MVLYLGPFPPLRADRSSALAPPQHRILSSGDTALVVEFGDGIDRGTSERVLALFERLRRAALPGVAELMPTFRSLMVHYDPVRTSRRALVAAIAPFLDGLEGEAPAGRVWEIPVCYDPTFGLDLAHVASATGLSQEAVIACHSSETYHVYMIGFTPGYPYMGDLPPALVLPRRENPRTQVPAGSVAIATAMTAVYTLQSPGGWHILGRTPLRLWSRERGDSPALLAPGDKVRFVPAGIDEFQRLEKQAAA